MGAVSFSMKETVCSVCDSEQDAPVEIPALGHNWGGWRWAHGEPPCNSSGAWQVRDCQRCGRQEDRWVEGGVHSFGPWQTTQDATCMAPGRQEHTCTLCGHRQKEPVPATGHAYEETDTAPTCTENGEKVFVCANCNDRYTEVIPALGHTPGEWTVAQAAQVNVPGEEQKVCQTCGEVLERREIPALPYIHAEGMTLSADALALHVGDAARLTAVIAPADATEPTWTFTSSDPDVAEVSPDGTIAAHAPGTAAVIAISTDGRATAACIVTVTYTPWQWVKHYILFGWAWE